MVDEVIQSMLEGAGEQLPLQVNGKETRAGVDVLIARHASVSSQNPCRDVDADKRLRQDAE